MMDFFTNRVLLHAAGVYAVVFFAFLIFNLWMRRSHKFELTMAFNFSNRELLGISALWPLCVIGFIFYLAVFLILHIPDILPPYGKKHRKARFDYSTGQVIYDKVWRTQEGAEAINHTLAQGKKIHEIQH